MIVSSCQHCDEQQFQILSCVYTTRFLLYVVKLDLFMRALLLDHILALENNTRMPHVHLVLKCHKTCEREDITVSDKRCIKDMLSHHGIGGGNTSFP